MNYYNPYLFSMPANYMVPKATGGILSRIFGSGGIKFGSILNGTQRVLNFTNQLIPVVKQVQPMVKNAKTMFRVMSEFKKNDYKNTDNGKKEYKNTIQKKEDNVDTVNNSYSNQGPTFFM